MSVTRSLASTVWLITAVLLVAVAWPVAAGMVAAWFAWEAIR